MIEYLKQMLEKAYFMWISNLRNVGFLAGAIGAVVAAPLIQAADSYVLGVCSTATQSEGAEIRPTIDGDMYLFDYHGNDPRYKEKSPGGPFFAGAKVTLIKTPAHGDVSLVDTPLGRDNNWYHYMPAEGFSGRDHFVMQVEKDGVKVRIQYVMEALDDLDTPTGRCHRGYWKISATSPELDNTNLQPLLGAANLGNGVTVDIANLTGSIAGKTTSSTNTLDTNAAGYSRFIDYTPYLNDEFLTTSDPYDWVS